MKKVYIILVMLIFCTFAIPIIFTKNSVSGKIANDTNEIKENNVEEIQMTDYDYKQYDTIKLLHADTGEIEELPLDTYLLGVVSAEMPANSEQEALNAQALVARTYTIYSIVHSGGKHGEADICDDSTCCQAWISKEDRMARWNEAERELNWRKIENAVNTTAGKIITYNGEVIDAFFHSNSGGTTEAPVNVWGGTNYPY